MPVLLHRPPQDRPGPHGGRLGDLSRAGGAVDLTQLRGLVGLRVSYQGQPCQIVEVLDEPPSLVLRPDGGARLMPDHIGRSYDFGAPDITLPVFNADRTGLNDDLLALET